MNVPTSPTGRSRPEESRDAIRAELAELAAVSLEELLVAAELLTRNDRKYVLEAVDVPALVRAIGGHARVLDVDGQRQFAYESVYFDTPELLTYRAAATHRPQRFKVRVRTYLDTDDRFVELKVMDRHDRTVKCRAAHAADARTLDEPAHDFLRGFESVAPHVDRLAPVLTTTYDRATLLLADGTRATIDTGLRASDGERQLALVGKAVVETKGGARLGRMDRVLRDLGHRRVPISKYATDLAALRPELPSTRWRPTLRRHFAAVVTEPVS